MVVNIRTKSCFVESISPPSGDGLIFNLSFARAEFQSNAPADDPLDNAPGLHLMHQFLPEIFQI